MGVFDGHVDTLAKLTKHAEQTLADPLRGHVDLARLQAGDVRAQVFAVFVPPRPDQHVLLDSLKMIHTFWAMVENLAYALRAIESREDLDLCSNDNRIGCLLALEGGDSLCGQIENVDILFRLGVRLITLTWNHSNELGVGIAAGAGGLRPFGRDVIAEMNRLGMLVDVSHLNELGFWDVLQTSRAPVLASHSNAYHICSHRRNLSDEQIRALANQGGVIGLNFCPAFLRADGAADITDVIKHIRHITAVGGEECIALGSDFDGIPDTPAGLEDCSCYPHLRQCLEQQGLSQTLIERLMWANLFRLTRQVLPHRT